MEIGHLQHVHEQYKDRGVVVLGFDSADEPKFAEELLAKKDVGYPNVLDPSAAASRVSDTDYRVSAYPTSYIIDREGKIAGSFTGHSEGDQRGIDLIEEVLAGVAGAGNGSPGGLTGVVTGPDGRPLREAIVRLWPTPKFFRKGYRHAQTRTDSAGRYELTGVKPGRYELTIQVVGAESYSVPVAVLFVRSGESGERAIEIPDTRLTGIVRRADSGAPLADDQVSLTATRVRVEAGKVVERDHARARARCDASGAFVFIGLSPGAYEIRALAGDPKLHDTVRVVELDESGQLTGLELELRSRKTGTLRVKVLDPDGKPAREVHFSISTGPSSSRSARATEIRDGLYELELEVGERTVRIYRRGSGADSLKVEIVADRTVERRARLAKRD